MSRFGTNRNHLPRIVSRKPDRSPRATICWGRSGNRDRSCAARRGAFVLNRESQVDSEPQVELKSLMKCSGTRAIAPCQLKSNPVFSSPTSWPEFALSLQLNLKPIENRRIQFSPDGFDPNLLDHFLGETIRQHVPGEGWVDAAAL